MSEFTSEEVGLLKLLATSLRNAKTIAGLQLADTTRLLDSDAEVLQDGVSKKTKVANIIPYVEDNAAYGVKINISTGVVTRIGNSDLHKSLPLQNRVKGCLLSDAGAVNEYMNPLSWIGHDRSGASGQVENEYPAHYCKPWTDGTYLYYMLSEYPLPGYRYVQPFYYSAYNGTIQISTGKLSSVVNLTADYRGANNELAKDGTYQSGLGMPRTNKNRTEFRTAARLRNPGSTEWNTGVYWSYLTIVWFMVVEYATLNLQAAFNAALDGSGYKQGGLGNGVSNLSSSMWSCFNGYNPFVANGYTDSLGNQSGEIALMMPFEYDSCLNISGTYTMKYVGTYDAENTYQVNDCVSFGANLYKCILESTGNEVTNATYFTQITRTVTYVNRYRGIEMPFGHIWQWLDGINIEIKTDADGGTSKVYVCDDPEKFSDSGYVDYQMRGLEARSEGYVKEILFGEHGDIIPKVVVSGSSSYYCDYHYTSVTSSSLRGVLVGGGADGGAPAGPFCVFSNRSPSDRSAYFGARLCYIPSLT